MPNPQIENLMAMALASGLTIDDLQRISQQTQGQVQMMAAGGATQGPRKLDQPTNVGPNRAVIPAERPAKAGAGKGAGVRLDHMLSGLALFPRELRSQILQNVGRMDLELMETGGTTVRPRQAIGGEAGSELELPAYFADGGTTYNGPFESLENQPDPGMEDDEELRRRLRELLGRDPTEDELGRERSQRGSITGRRSTVNPGGPENAFGTTIQMEEAQALGLADATTVPYRRGPDGAILSGRPGSEGAIAEPGSGASYNGPIGDAAQPQQTAPTQQNVDPNAQPTEFRSLLGRDPEQWAIIRDAEGHLTWQRRGAPMTDGLQEGRVLPEGVYLDQGGIPAQLLPFMRPEDVFPGVSSPEMARYLYEEALKGAHGTLMAPGSNAGLGGFVRNAPESPSIGQVPLGSGDLPSARVGTGPMRQGQTGQGQRFTEEQLQDLARQGLTPEQVEELRRRQGPGQGQGQGYSPEQLQDLQAQGLTPEQLQQVGGRGGETVTIDGKTYSVAQLRLLQQQYASGDRRYTDRINQAKAQQTYVTDYGALAQLDAPKIGEFTSPRTGASFKVTAGNTPGTFTFHLANGELTVSQGDTPAGSPNWRPVSENISLDEAKQKWAILMSGQNPATVYNDAARLPDLSGDVMAQYETSPFFRRAVDDAVAYFDSEEGVQGRVKQAADTDPAVRRTLATELIDSGQLPLPEEEVRVAKSAVTEVDESGQERFRSGITVESPVYNDQGAIIEAVIVTENGSRYRFRDGEDQLLLLGDDGQVVGGEPQAPVDEEPAPAEAGPVVLDPVDNVTGTPAGYAEGPGGTPVEIFTGSDGQVYWKDPATGEYFLFEEGEQPVPVADPRKPKRKSPRATTAALSSSG